MEPNTSASPLIVIAGPTGSGKSALGIDMAAKFEGEIICADSRTIYKGMNIGTAKPSEMERQAVPHHLLDVTTPDRPITVAEFKVLAQKAIMEIASRGKVPFLVGGSGLYIDAVVYDFSFRGTSDPAVRSKLDALSVEELQKKLIKTGLDLPENYKNKRHLIRRLESRSVQPKNNILRQDTLLLGLELENDLLKDRLAKRLDVMIAEGLEGEVRDLSDRYGWDCTPLQTIGYQEFNEYFNGSATLADVKQAILRSSIRYAKRQRTWFKRNKHMHYIRKVDEAVDLITTFLNKKAAQ